MCYAQPTPLLLAFDIKASADLIILNDQVDPAIFRPTNPRRNTETPCTRKCAAPFSVYNIYIGY